MQTDFFAMPHLTLPARRAARPPLGRLVAFLAVVTLCLLVDALIVFALYKTGAALLAGLEWQTLVQAALGSSVLLYLLYRSRRGSRHARAGRESGGEPLP